MKYLILIVIFLSSCSFSSKKKHQTNTNNDSIVNSILVERKKDSVFTKEITSSYSYDTILKGNYHLSYQIHIDSLSKEKDTLQSLLLMKNNEQIAVINSNEYPLPLYNLGYIEEDFDDSFVFIQQYGWGRYVQVVDKLSGKDLVYGIWVDIDSEEKIILYVEEGTEEDMRVYDIKHSQIIDISNETNYIYTNSYCTHIDSVTDTEIILCTEIEDKKVFKKYKRNK